MTILQRLQTALQGLITGAGEFWHKDLEPWLVDTFNLVKHDIVTTLIPYAAEALGEVKSGVQGQMTPEQTAAALELTLNKAANAGIHTAEQDVSGEAAQALASVIKTVQAGETAANQSVVAQVAAVVDNTQQAATQSGQVAKPGT